MREKSTILERFGKTVRAARADAGLTQEELAHRSDLDRSYVGGIERGVRNPTIKVIGQVADGLGMSVADLFSKHYPER